MIKIEIKVPEKMIVDASLLIEKFKSKNHLRFDLEIDLDYSIKDGGNFIYRTPHKILINPSKCAINDYSFPCYVNDSTVFGAVIHEFAHFLTLHFYKDFMPKYEKKFGKKVFKISEYPTKIYDKTEEVAELLQLYLSNPYLLKLITKERYDFFRTWFKSPVPCTERRCYIFWTFFGRKIRRKLKEKLNISFDRKGKLKHV